MSPPPRVTVVIATYNWAPVLPTAIASVLDQTHTDLELLVVGDGCTDESAEVVGAIDDERVRWINLPTNHRHQWAPNNEGIRQARGTLIAYLGHDDLWLPRHLERLTAAIDDGAVLAHDRVLMVDPGAPLRTTPAAGWHFRPGTWIPPTSVLHRRDAVEAVGPWRPPDATGALDPENDLWARLAERYGPPTPVATLGSIKLSAAKRAEVYRDRPSIEQRDWLERIRACSDPEVELAALEGRPPPASTPPAQAWPLTTRLWRKVNAVPRKVRGRPTYTAVERQTDRRRFKGLPDSSSDRPGR